VPIDIRSFLGSSGVETGVINHARHCFVPWGQALEAAKAPADLLDKLQDKFKEAMGEAVKGYVTNQALLKEKGLTGAPLLQLTGLESSDDPRFRRLRSQLADVLSRFVLSGDGTRFCLCGEIRPGATPPGEHNACGHRVSWHRGRGSSCALEWCGVLSWPGAKQAALLPCWQVTHHARSPASLTAATSMPSKKASLTAPAAPAMPAVPAVQ